MSEYKVGIQETKFGTFFAVETNWTGILNLKKALKKGYKIAWVMEKQTCIYCGGGQKWVEIKIPQ